MNSSITEDGSSTLYSEVFQSHYHSTHGAINESMHVFIEYGLSFYNKSGHTHANISILEYGLGTALNALLTAETIKNDDRVIKYTSLEAYPISTQQHHDLNYGQLRSATELFDKIYAAPWGQMIPITPNFSLRKIETKFEDYEADQQYDIIYYDAFAPTSQAHLWEEAMMKKCHENLKKGGILVTFSAKGSFKRALKSVGFEVERLPGPPGKREMTRATKA